MEKDPKPPLTRDAFETIISKHKHSLDELNDMYKRGILKDGDYVFTLDDVIAICAPVARSFFDFAAYAKSPAGKSSISERRPRLITKIIKEAFTANNHGQS